MVKYGGMKVSKEVLELRPRKDRVRSLTDRCLCYVVILSG